MKRLLCLAAVGIVLLSACASDEEPALATPPPGDSPAPSAAQVAITKPADDSTMDAGPIEVVASVQNFDVVDKLGVPPVEGEGHLHFYIDADPIPTTPDRPAVTADAKTYHATATTKYTWPDVKPGRHTFAVQLVNNNHTPLQPPVTAEVTVTVR